MTLSGRVALLAALLVLGYVVAVAALLAALGLG